MEVFHVGFDIIENPDIKYGRKNADFGQGFYLSPEEEFAKRWAKSHKTKQTILNKYDLNLDGLKVYRFEKDSNWFEYIYRNRHAGKDNLDADVIIGPIANDTLFDTFGIITSGILSPKQCEALLMIGPTYNQIVIKTNKAVNNLQWIDNEIIKKEEIERYSTKLKIEEERYQNEFAMRMDNIDEL